MSPFALARHGTAHSLRSCSRRHFISAASSTIRWSAFERVLIVGEVGLPALLARRLVVCSCGGHLVVLVEGSEMSGLSVGIDLCHPLVGTIWFVWHV